MLVPPLLHGNSLLLVLACNCREGENCMRRFALAVGLVLCLGYTAKAQGSPEWEISGGGSFSHTEVSPPLPNISTVNGWGYDLGVAQYLNSWIGGVIKFSDYYRSPTIDMGSFGLPGITERVRAHSLYLLAGPQVRHRFANVTFFGHATPGFSRRTFQDQHGFINTDHDAFAFGAGGGVDFNLREHVAIRAVEGDYVITNFAGNLQNNWKVSAGVVFSWGRK